MMVLIGFSILPAAAGRPPPSSAISYSLAAMLGSLLKPLTSAGFNWQNQRWR